MTRPTYPCDLTHVEWQLLEPKLPALKGRPPMQFALARKRERLPVRAAHRMCLALFAA